MAKPSITKRLDKGSALDYQELDDNFQNIIDSILTVTDGVDDINLELIDTLEFATDHNIKVTVTPSGNIVTVDNELPIIVKEPTGFEVLADSSLAFDDATRTFTIVLEHPEDFAVFVAGEEYLKTASESIVIPDVTDLYLIVYDNTGTLQYKTGYLDFDAEAPVAHVYWNATTGEGRLAEQRHGIAMSWATHEYLHRTRGAAFANGLAISNFTTLGDGTADADAEFDLSNGTFFDEDLKFNIVHSNTPTLPFEQDLQGPARIPVAYHSGSTGEWVFDTATDFAVKVGTIVKYNLNTAGTWTTPDIPNTHFVAMWIIASNFIDEPIIAIMGQRTDNKLDDAKNNNTYASLDLTNFPSEEFRPLYRIIFRSDSGYTNTPKAYIADVTDFRQTVVGGGSAAALAPSGFGTIAVAGQNPVIAEQVNDTLTLAAGTNVTITTDDATDTVTINASGGLTNIVEDLTPQLGGDLDVNGFSIVSASNGNIVLEPNGTGDVFINADTVRIGDENANVTLDHWGTGTTVLRGGLTEVGSSNRATITLGAIEAGDTRNQNIIIRSDYRTVIDANGVTGFSFIPALGQLSYTNSTFSIRGGEGVGSGVALREGVIQFDSSTNGFSFNSGTGVLATIKGGSYLATADIRLFAGGTNGAEVRAKTDGDLQLTPRSTGKIIAGSGSANANITSNGAYDLVLDTNSGTNSGSITIQDGTTGNIILASRNDISLTIENSANKGIKISEEDIGDPGVPVLVPVIQPAGSGTSLAIFASDSLGFGSTTGNITIEPGAGTGDLEVVGNLVVDGDISTVTGNITATDTDASITLTPDGTGVVVIDSDLDIVTGAISTSTLDTDITITPNGTGVIVLDGDVTINGETGNTPVDDTTTAAYLEIEANGQTYYLPLYQ